MKKYAILQHPGHNRVYYMSAGKLALAECEIALSKIGISTESLDIIDLKGILYVVFNSEEALKDDELKLISRLSFVFAMYEIRDIDGEECLVPLQQFDYTHIDPKISSILKYSGKTNELFTKMMVNVALLASKFNYDNINLLDPVAGKGTTLYEAAVYGFNAYGIEPDSKSVHETNTFFKKYLERERYKHVFNKRQMNGRNKAEAHFMHEYTYARNKEEFKSEELTRTLGVLGGEAQRADEYFKPNTFHIIVGDLPYGIAHGNRGPKNYGTITRNPSELLEQSLDAWYEVLKVGGVVVVAWNSYIVTKKRVADIFAKHGFDVLDNPPYDQFEHNVDRSIRRDMIVARKR